MMTHNIIYRRCCRQLSHSRQHSARIGKFSVWSLSPVVPYVAIVVVPVVAHKLCRCGSAFGYGLLFSLIETAHKRHSVGDEEGVALRIRLVGKSIWMVDKSLALVVHVVTSHLDYKLIYLAESCARFLLLKAIASIVEYLLQLVGTGSVLGFSSSVFAIAILRNVEHNGVVACLIGELRVSIRLIGSYVHLTVLDTVGVVHVGEWQVNLQCLFVLVEVFGSTVQALCVFLQSVVVGSLGFVTGFKRVVGGFFAAIDYNVLICRRV